MRVLSLCRVRVVLEKSTDIVHHRVYRYALFKVVLRKKDSVPIWKKVTMLHGKVKLFPGDLVGYDILVENATELAERLGVSFVPYLRNNDVAKVSLLEMLGAIATETVA